MKEIVEKLLHEAVDANPDLFLVDWKITEDNKIQVHVDGDHGLALEEIVRISRHIEHNIDRDEHDFELTVSSPGVSTPLSTPRQYRKNIGRIIKILTPENEEFKGEITAATEEAVTIRWEVREPKPVGKGKHTVEKIKEIPYTDIKKAIIQIDI
ncbi:MAG: ribosome assembly cofactor RimP [Weeksellaceae bacterium]|nr:ribosome assembly cofactor RimP [Weeksellaceae bacterium]